MNFVIINNGLGNQMSQYAFYIAMKQENNQCIAIFDPLSRMEHNGSELDKLFDINYKQGFFVTIARKIYRFKKRPKIWKLMSYCGIREIKEPINYDYHPEYLKYKKFGINYFVGGWHSEKYFMGIENTIREIFKFDEKLLLSNEVGKVANHIRVSSSSVSIHVRRGDYLKIKDDNPYQLAGVAGEDYYHRAISTIFEKVANPIFFCFSDDLIWCENKFKGIDIIFVDCNRGNDSWKDMYLMSLCKYHINANSTFSWWGAWLSNNKDGFTLCPDHFLRNTITKDIYPEKWIKVETK